MIAILGPWLYLLLQWSVQPGGATASLRGISAVNDKVAWASGAKGTVLRTIDGGLSWSPHPVPGGESLDFRDLEAFDSDTAILMSAGPGALSTLYKTTDGGAHWTLLFQNKQEKGFFDSIAFWDRKRGVVLGDPVDGRMVVLRTEDGGGSWQPVDPTKMPAAQEGEGAFAASGTSVAVRPNGKAWFATGGIGGARVFRSSDWGQSWEVVQTPVRHDCAGCGIFSIAFWDDTHGIVVGGNYTKPAEQNDNIALTSDGGRSWNAPGNSHPGGYRSAVLPLSDGKTAVATGAGGSDVSRDQGHTWSKCGDTGYHALSGQWAVGDKGSIARAVDARICR